MSKHDRPKLAKIPWHYIIIDEGHRIKNASCKLNAELKLYQSTHRLLLTGTPIQVSRTLAILADCALSYLLVNVSTSVGLSWVPSSEYLVKWRISYCQCVHVHYAYSQIYTRLPPEFFVSSGEFFLNFLYLYCLLYYLLFVTDYCCCAYYFRTIWKSYGHC